MTFEELERLREKAGITMEDLMAYADGVLAPDRRAAVREALEKYPALMQLLEIFLFTRGPLAEAFNGVLVDPLPEKLLAGLLKPEELPAQPRRKVSRFNPRSLWPFRFSVRTPVFAIAALAGVVLAAWLLGDAIPYEVVARDQRGLAAPSSLQQALDRIPMGGSARLAEHLSIEPKLTFFSRLKIWCREYELVYGKNELWQRKLACRGKDGMWRTWNEANPMPGRLERELAAEDQAVLDQARADLKDGDVLSVEEERGVIAKRWKRKP